MAYNEFAYFYDEFNGEADYDALYDWSVAHPEQFWVSVWEGDCGGRGVIGDRGERVADGVELDGQCGGCHGFSPVRRGDPMNPDQRSELGKSYTQNPTEGRVKG